MTNEVTIRIGGESGEGTISGGDILALAVSAIIPLIPWVIMLMCSSA